MTYRPEHAGVIPENTLGLDDDNMLEYRHHLHAVEFRDLIDHENPGRVRFDNATWDNMEHQWVIEGECDLLSGVSSDEIDERVEELMAQGVDEETATRDVLWEMLEAVNAHCRAWSDDLIPKVIVRIESIDAVRDHLTEGGWLDDEDVVPPTRDQIESAIALHLEDWFGWSEIHWMDRCEPVHGDLPVAWGEDGPIQVLAPVTPGEIEWAEGIYAAIIDPY